MVIISGVPIFRIFTVDCFETAMQRKCFYHIDSRYWDTGPALFCQEPLRIKPWSTDIVVLGLRRAGGLSLFNHKWDSIAHIDRLFAKLYRATKCADKLYDAAIYFAKWSLGILEGKYLYV